MVRRVGKLDRDAVIRSDCAGSQNNGHDAGAGPSRARKKGRFHQAWPESVKLFARRSEAGQFDDRVPAKVKPGAKRKIEKRKSSRGDVFPEISCLERRYSLAAGNTGFGS